VGRRLAGDLDVEPGLAGFQDAAHLRFHRVGQAGQHLPDRLSDVVSRRDPVDFRQPLIDPEEPQTAVQHAQSHGRVVIQVLDLRQALTRQFLGGPQRLLRLHPVGQIDEGHRQVALNSAARIGHCRRDMARDQVEERPVLSVQRTARADAEHQEPGHRLVRRKEQRQHDRLRCRLRPGPAEKFQTADIGRSPGLQHRGESCRRDGVCGKVAAGVQAIDTSERNVMCVLTQDRFGSRTGIGDRIGLHRLLPEPAERFEPPRAHDFPCGFVAGAEEAVDRPRISPNRAVGKREIPLFPRQCSVNHIEKVLRPRGLPRPENLVP
jgi:hypothetical protein